jgi:hypothetical protein
MGYSVREAVFDAAFVLLAIAFAVGAAHAGLPAGAFLAGAVAISGLYGWLGLKCDERAAERASKERLILTDQSVICTDWLGRTHPMRWDRVERIGFARLESLFPDPWLGDYAEEYWFLMDGGDGRIVIPLELGRAHDLNQALAKRFPGFDAELARQALEAEQEGQWLLWHRGTGPAAA